VLVREFLFAVFGGFAVNFLRLFEIAKLPKSERPETFSDWLYVLQFFGMPLIGGVLALAYSMSGTALTPILAVNIGASAPLILKTFASVLPEVGAKRVD
jgi:hypothetical protein